MNVVVGLSRYNRVVLCRNMLKRCGDSRELIPCVKQIACSYISSSISQRVDIHQQALCWSGKHELTATPLSPFPLAPSPPVAAVPPLPHFPESPIPHPPALSLHHPPTLSSLYSALYRSISIPNLLSPFSHLKTTGDSTDWVETKIEMIPKATQVHQPENESSQPSTCTLVFPL